MSDPIAHPAWVGSVDQYPVPVALSNGIPALMVELVSSHTVLDASRGRKGVMNVMKELKMMEGSRERKSRRRCPADITTGARSPLRPRVWPGRASHQVSLLPKVTPWSRSLIFWVTSWRR